jgi:enoyl-CoA hydratase
MSGDSAHHPSGSWWYHVAMELALTGELITAERAHAMGLVNRVADRGAALAVAEELAGVVARNGPLTLDASKRILQEALDWTTAQAWDNQRPVVPQVFGSRDAQEGGRVRGEARPRLARGMTARAAAPSRALTRGRAGAR